MYKRQLPPRFADAAMSNLHPIFDGVKAYLSDLPRAIRAGEGLFLSGPPGVGKTYAIAALTAEAAKGVNYSKGKDKFLMRIQDYLFATGPELFEHYALPFASELDRTEEIQSTRWLVINDLGKEYRGGAYVQQVPYKLGRLLRHRVERNLTTFITTNLHLHPVEGLPNNSIMEVYGESIHSLIQEACPHRYEVEGPDRRKGQQ